MNSLQSVKQTDNKDRRKSTGIFAAGRRGASGIHFLNKDSVSRPLLAMNAILALLYLYIIAFWFPRGNLILFYFLIFGEIFHVWQTLTFIQTIWRPEFSDKFDPDFGGGVDVFITVCGEPVDVVQETVLAAKAMTYPDMRIFILNDGFVAKKENWKEIEAMAKKLKVHCITRRVAGGAKAGNINHALARTGSSFVAIFDADHVPHPDFLTKMMGYFTDPRVGFVQAPQFYRNRGLNYVTAGAWEQQELFFGTICPGKRRLNATFLCGTNMILRRATLEEVGGIYEGSITEDFLTSQFIHERGWRSVYVPEVLSEGLAPEDFLSYTKQQFRWARGSLDVLFKHNPMFRSGMSLGQKMQYLASSSFYASGLIVLMNAIFPLVFFFTGAVPFILSTMVLAAVFLPYIGLTVYNLRRASGYNYTYRAVAFSLGSFWIHLRAILSVVTGRKNAFEVTSKKQLEGNFTSLVIPHFVYICLVGFGLIVAVLREGWDASVVTNLSWALFNVAMFVPFIIAAMPSWDWLLAEEKVPEAIINRRAEARLTATIEEPEQTSVNPGFSKHGS